MHVDACIVHVDGKDVFRYVMESRRMSHSRRSIRLKGYDYRTAGAYFLTICAHNRRCLFGVVADGEVRLNQWGEIVEECWRAIPSHNNDVGLDSYVVMPNHVHGIIVLTWQGRSSPESHTSAVDAAHEGSLPCGPKSHSIGAIVGGFKSSATRRISVEVGCPVGPVWQRNYHEHVIRDERSLDTLRRYILENPLRWEMDPENLG